MTQTTVAVVIFNKKRKPGKVKGQEISEKERKA